MAKYIDREYAFKELNDQCKITGYGGITPYDLKKVFERLPGIDMRENVHGEWEVVDAEEPRRYGCSICKVLVWHESDYCPHCGAVMDARKSEGKPL